MLNSAVWRIKHHSTETAFLTLHDHIIKAMCLQQVTCLTLLDLSAAFDTIDHSILLERLSSWFDFGISSTALSWIKSYFLDFQHLLHDVLPKYKHVLSAYIHSFPFLIVQVMHGTGAGTIPEK